jgi:hypothetical protein
MAPAWLQALAPAEWYERYARRVENYRLPKTEAARQELAVAIGIDGRTLLEAIDRATGQPWLAQIPAVQVLRRVWAEQYVEQDGQVRWRPVEEMPPPSPRPTTRTRATAPSGRARGSATRCTSPRPATPTPPTSSSTSRPRPRQLRTTTCSRSFTSPWKPGICFPPSTWWTRATRTRGCWSTAGMTMASPSPARWLTTRAGRPARKMGSTSRSSWSTGIGRS